MSKITKRRIKRVEVEDGAATPNKITLRVDGTVSASEGGYELTDDRDVNGDFTDEEPSRGDEQATTVTLEMAQRGLANGSGSLAAITLADVAFRTTGFEAQMTSIGTGTNCDDTEPMYKINVVFDDCSSGEVTWTFDRCTWTSDFTKGGGEGNRITMNVTSRAAKWAVS